MMRQQRRISVGVPGGAPGGGRPRRVSVTNKLGQTITVPGASNQYQPPSGLRASRKSIVGGVRAPDGRRRSCFAAKGGGGAPGVGVGGIGAAGGAVDAAELIRRRDVQERAARGRRASLLAQARGAGGGAQVAPLPPQPQRQPAAVQQQPQFSGELGGNIQARMASTGSCADSDDEDELILAAVAFMNGEAPAPQPQPQPKKSTAVAKKSEKKPKKKNRLSAKHRREKKRLSDFSLMYDSYCNSLNYEDDNDNESDYDSNSGGNDEPGIPAQIQATPSSTAAEAYRLAMEREQAALAEASKMISQPFGGGGPSTNQQHPGHQQQTQDQHRHPGRTSLISRKELPTATKKRDSVVPTYEELEEYGIPAVQLTNEPSVVSPELARHRARMAEAENRTQAMMEGMTLEQHKKLLQERFGQGSSTQSAPSNKAASPAQQLSVTAFPLPPPTEEKPVSAELLRHRKRVEEAERATQATLEGMTLDQHKKLLQERFGKSSGGGTETTTGTDDETTKEPVVQQKPPPSAALLDTLEQARAASAPEGSPPPTGPSRVTPVEPTNSRRMLSKEEELGLAYVTSADMGNEPPSASTTHHQQSHLSFSRMDSRDDAVQAVGNRWRQSANHLRSGEKSDRWTNRAINGAGPSARRMDSTLSGTSEDERLAGRTAGELESAQARALRAVVRSRNSRRDAFESPRFGSTGDDRDGTGEERRSSEDILAMTNRLFEDIDTGIDDDRVVKDAMSASSSSSSRNPADDDYSSSSEPDADKRNAPRSVADAIAALPSTAKTKAAAHSRRKSSLNSLLDEESTSSLLSWGAAATGGERRTSGGWARRRRLSDSASSLRLSTVNSSPAAAARRRRSSGGSADLELRNYAGGWEHPLGWPDALTFIGGLAEDLEREKASYAWRRHGRRAAHRGGSCSYKSEDGGSDASEDDGAAARAVRRGEKRVRFPRDDADGVSSSRDVPHLIDFSPSERSAAWRTPSDQECTRDDVLVAMMSLRNGDGIRCGRGLEALASDEEWELRRISRDFVAAAVLEEQRAQGLLTVGGGNVVDVEEIAAASRARSKVSVEAALETAAADENFVQENVRQASYDERIPARKNGTVVGRGGGAPPSSRFQRFGVGAVGGGGSGGAVFGANAIPGLGLISKRLSAEKCKDKLSDGDLICDFQRQGRQLFSKLRGLPGPGIAQVRSSTAA